MALATSKELAMSRRKVSRNAPCPCGSGKKYKQCCLRKDSDRLKDAPEFPIGTIALYGPDDKTTTKIVAGAILEENAEAIIERWVGTDVTENPKIRKEIGEFFAKHGVESVVASEHNMGCPHEEGEDFPLGEDCPFCPYWKGKQGTNASF